MTEPTDILWEVERCAEAARRNKVYLSPTFVVENWPHATLVGAADEIRKLRAQVDRLRSICAVEGGERRAKSISDRVKKGLP